MKRLLLILIGLCLMVALPASAVRLKKGPGQTEETFMIFGMQDSTVVADQCAVVLEVGSVVACGTVDALYYTGDAWVITRISLTIGFQTWGGAQTAEACDVDVDINGSTITTFDVGGVGLRLAGDSSSVTTFVTSTLAVGDSVRVRHQDPTTNFCVAGDETCDCDGASGAYSVRIYGFRP